MEKREILPIILRTSSGLSSKTQDKLSALQKWSWKGAAIIFSAYTVYLLLCLLQIYLRYTWSGDFPADWLKDVEYTVVFSYIWAIITPILLMFSNRFPVSRKHLIRNVSLHIIFGILVVSLHRIIILTFAYFCLDAEIRMGDTLSAKITYALHHITDGLFTYIFIVAVYQAFLYFREAQDREFRLQQAELQTLKMQLHPHFLFNTLNAISALIFIAPQHAAQTIGELSDLLRLALNSSRTQEVTLKEELDFLRKYIQIQQTLLRERLTVKWTIEPETLDAMIPNMLLQPLVENSIKHGIAPKEEGGEIEIRVQRKGNSLRLNIIDDGLGISFSKSTTDSGIGLENTRIRLRHLYGEAHEISLIEPADGGLTVSLTIPFTDNKN